MPAWMRRPLAAPGRSAEVSAMLDELRLNTVCTGAKCPNRGECFASGTATFMVLGSECTRDCRFCAVDAVRPAPPDADEPARVAEAAERMEVLVSDFGGDLAAVDTVAAAGPDVFNHNVETVPRLYPEVRPQADYARSLRVLARVREVRPDLPTKSGLMVGLGEEPGEVEAVLGDLRAVGVDIVTIGQYLRPSAKHLPVAEFVTPERFERYATAARELGFAGVASAPFVRSSYRASEVAADAEAGRATH
jgi:lipoic acid synthetase